MLSTVSQPPKLIRSDRAMDNEKEFLEFVGTASESAGAFAGKVATIGSKIAGFAGSGISAGKEMLGLVDEKSKGMSEKNSDTTKSVKANPDIAAVRQKLVNAGRTQSRLELQLRELKTKNQSLASELDRMRGKLNESRSREDAFRTRTADGSEAKLESELAATQRELEKMREEMQKTRSQFELKLESMQAEKESLLSELATAKKETAATTTRENALTEQVAALESKFDVIQRELAETQSQAEKTQFELASRLKDSQVEKDSLILDLEKARDQSNEMIFREEQVNGQAAKLESELATARQELADVQSHAEYAETQLNKQLRDLQAENESLLFKLADARKEADDERIRADSMEAQIALLESDVAAFGAGLEETHKEESGIITDVAEDQISMPADTGSLQTDQQEELAIVPTVEEIKPSIEVATAQEESIGTNVENVEVQEPILEYEARVDTEEAEFGPMPEVEATEPLEVTVGEVQTAVFKNEADKILFSKAFSDFTSRDAAVRVDAVKVIAGIHHELSLRFLITHISNEPSALVRLECIKSLAMLEMKEGIVAVKRALADGAASVRLAAVWGLYRLAGIESIPLLIPMFSDNDEEVRRRAITCIGWAGEQIAKADKHYYQQVISALIQCLSDSAGSIKNAALNALQAVTGKTMSTKQISPERLIGQWRSWWKEELICS